jgi:hypothetical protein
MLIGKWKSSCTNICNHFLSKEKRVQSTNKFHNVHRQSFLIRRYISNTGIQEDATQKKKHKKHEFLNFDLRIRSSVKFDETFPLELGGSLKQLEITWEEWGPKEGPVILVIPSLSMGSHACSSMSDPTPGWWEGKLYR